MSRLCYISDNVKVILGNKEQGSLMIYDTYMEKYIHLLSRSLNCSSMQFEISKLLILILK